MYTNRLILVLTIGMFLLSPLLVNWYAQNQDSWYPPFIAWGGLILIAFWMTLSKDLND